MYHLIHISEKTAAYIFFVEIVETSELVNGVPQGDKRSALGTDFRSEAPGLGRIVTVLAITGDRARLLMA
jgi:hypothetical protein